VTIADRVDQTQNPIVSFNGSERIGFTRASRLKYLRAMHESRPDEFSHPGSGKTIQYLNSVAGSGTFSLSEGALSGEIMNSKRQSLFALEREDLPVSSRTVVQGMEKWTGIITEVTPDLFTAELATEDQGESGSPLEADFLMVAVSPEDRGLVHPGAGFYVTVRTVLDDHSRSYRTSALRFRRLGVWTAFEIEELESRARSGLERVRDAID
jgi:hypothetical protein